MYRVAVVDDEYIARKTLKKYFEIYASDFKVVETFENGEDLIEYLKDNSVDVVFSDVKMPGITGIELAKYIYENYPEIKVVIVSGYSEFRWAQEAMRYRVVYYLLKVVDVKEFVAVTEFLRNELKMKDEGENTMDLQRFFYNLMFGIFKTEEEMSLVFHQNSGKNAQTTNSLIITVALDENEQSVAYRYHDAEDMETALVNFIKMLYHSENVIVVNEDNGEYKFIILNDNAAADKISAEETEKEISATLNIKAQVRSIENMYVSELFRNLNNVAINDDNKNKLINSEKMEKQEFKTEFIKKVKLYIDEHYSEEISRKVIADRFAMNPDYLGRQFKEITGKSIIEYIQEKRIEKAKKLIEEDVEFDNICGMVGYVDIRSFKRLFKKFTGMGLREYKEKLKNEDSG